MDDTLAEDVEKLRKQAVRCHENAIECVAGDLHDHFTDQSRFYYRVSDTLETAQAENARLADLLDKFAAAANVRQAEAQEKDETIARLRGALERIKGKLTFLQRGGRTNSPVADEEVRNCLEISRAALSPEQGDENG